MLLLLGMGIAVHAQFSGSSGMIKTSAGYAHDFPGLNGYTFGAEYGFPLTPFLQGGIGMKHANMQGYPRSSESFEYTRANSLDFNIYWAPLCTEEKLFRVGLGYSFSLFNIQRAYPLVVDFTNNKSAYSWHTQQSKGAVSGINLLVEYQQKIPNTRYSVGMSAALYKAYSETKYVGLVLGYQL